jgi:hypothetical protein
MAVGGVILWAVTRRLQAHLRFFILYTWCLSCIVLLGTLAHIYIVPQPHRYQIAMDLGICLVFVFGGARLLSLSRHQAFLQRVAVDAILIACAVALLHDRQYAHQIIRSGDITKSSTYRVAQWMDQHMHGARVMVSGAYSFYFNDFTDTPQLHGGHDPMQPSSLIPVAAFTIYSGMNAGTEDAAISTLWLQALGVHAVSVPGPGSAEYYKPFVSPRKFEGILPVLWREGDDTIYGVPAQSDSLAHLVPEEALVRTMPANGLDVKELRRYVGAINDPAMPNTPLVWLNRHRVEIQAPLKPRTPLSVQIRYHPGWHASVNGKAMPISPDGLGLIVVRPECAGPCTIILNYNGGLELKLTIFASLLVMLGIIAAGAWRRRPI